MFIHNECTNCPLCILEDSLALSGRAELNCLIFFYSSRRIVQAKDNDYHAIVAYFDTFSHISAYLECFF